MQTSSDIVPGVISAIARVKEMPVDSITADQSFEDLGMDSLDGLNVIFEIESTFRITIPTEEAMTVRSVQDIVDRLQQILAGTGTGAGV